MTLTRRRFLTISAAFAALPATATAHSWRGFAFGAEVSMTIRGPKAQATAALNAARKVIREMEELFSLFDPHSTLSLLNASGVLTEPDKRFVQLMQAANTAHTLTGGLFDPSVQPLWQALVENRDPADVASAIGWNHVQFDMHEITLAPSQALTFNGIAQGFATDLVAQTLTERGLTNTLVNIGEYRSTGGPWSLGLQDPVHGVLGQRTLSNGAIATSSPAATQLGSQGHILHPSARPLWSTVSVEAASATVADSLSTAMVLAPRNQIKMIKDQADLTRVTLVTFDGDLITI